MSLRLLVRWLVNGCGEHDCYSSLETSVSEYVCFKLLLVSELLVWRCIFVDYCISLCKFLVDVIVAAVDIEVEIDGERSECYIIISLVLQYYKNTCINKTEEHSKHV